MNLWINLNAYLLYSLIMVVCKTLRLDIHGQEIVDAIKAKKGNILFAVWHQATFVMLYLYRDQGACVVTTPERRGLVLGKVAEKLGYINITMPIDGEKLDAARGFARMLKNVRKGHDAVIAVDGPKGPSFEVKPGAAYLAGKAGIPIVPIGVQAPFKLTLFWRWDKYFIPLPFSKVKVVAGEQLASGEELKDRIIT